MRLSDNTRKRSSTDVWWSFDQGDTGLPFTSPGEDSIPVVSLCFSDTGLFFEREKKQLWNGGRSVEVRGERGTKNGTRSVP